jgi:hypothetical protein
MHGMYSPPLLLNDYHEGAAFMSDRMRDIR